MFLAPGSSPEMTYVDTPPTTVPPEASYEEDWEVFDPYVNIAHTFFSLSNSQVAFNTVSNNSVSK